MSQQVSKFSVSNNPNKSSPKPSFDHLYSNVVYKQRNYSLRYFACFDSFNSKWLPETHVSIVSCRLWACDQNSKNMRVAKHMYFARNLQDVLLLHIVSWPVYWGMYVLYRGKMYCCSPVSCLFLKSLPYLWCFLLFLGFLLFIIVAFNIHFNVTIITFFAVM